MHQNTSFSHQKS